MTAATTRPPDRTLGVLGGMGPAATAEFLRLLASDAPATEDGHHPRIVMLSEPAIPDRTVAILRNDPRAARLLRECLATLVGWGADLLAIPCNTAHVFLGALPAALSAPIVDIVDATLDEAVRLSPEGGWLTATTGTVVSGIYQDRAAARGYRLYVPDATTQKLIHETAVQVKAERIERAGRLYGDVVEGLWRQRALPVVAACTELPLAYRATPLPPESMVSSLRALSRACVDRLYAARTLATPAPAPASVPLPLSRPR